MHFNRLMMLTSYNVHIVVGNSMTVLQQDIFHIVLLNPNRFPDSLHNNQGGDDFNYIIVIHSIEL